MGLSIVRSRPYERNPGLRIAPLVGRRRGVAAKVCPCRTRRLRRAQLFDTVTTSSPAPQDFESALAELEGIVAAMEGGQMTLADSLQAYRRGAELAAFCQGALKDAQQQVEILEKGMLKPFVAGNGDDGA